jgi:hypothetical protein
MDIMKAICYSILLIWLFVLTVTAQEDDFLVQRELWRVRSETITNNLLKEAAKTDALDRALIYAQLSELWWEFDKPKSNQWIEKAVDSISFYPSEDAKIHRKELLQTSRQILRIISNRNLKQSNRLVEILSKVEESTDSEKNGNADALIEYALRIVKTNPSKAAELGTIALRLGQPKEFYSLAWELRRYNPALANQFWKTAFSATTNSLDYYMLNGMKTATFPETDIPNFPQNLQPPLELKVTFLSFLADYIWQQQQKFTSKIIPKCANEAIFVSRLKNQFANLLPQKSALVEQAISTCWVDSNPKLSELVSQAPSAKTTNIDELLKQADDPQNTPLVRANLLIMAASAAYQQKKYAVAVNVLEKMTEEERKPNLQWWEELRSDSAAFLAAAQFKDDNFAGAMETLKNVPFMLRPLAETGFVFQFSPEDASSYQFCVERLCDARRGFTKSELAFARKTPYWFSLVKLYSKYKLQAEAAEVFREIAVAFNNSLSNDNSTANDALSNRLIAESKLTIPTLSPSLFETQENSIFESIGLLKQEKPRVEMNLAFLKLTLSRYKFFDSEVRKKVSEKSNNAPAVSQRN